MRTFKGLRSVVLNIPQPLSNEAHNVVASLWHDSIDLADKRSILLHNDEGCE